MAEIFQILQKNINFQSEEACKTSNGISSKRSTPAHIRVKLSKKIY